MSDELKRDDGGPAFGGEIDEVFVNTSPNATPQMREPIKFKRIVRGMSLRDYFAAKAMAAMAEGICAIDDLGIIRHRPNDVAQIAYVYADAMLEARK